MATTLDAPTGASLRTSEPALRTLYLARALFAVVWALVVAVTARGADTVGPLLVALLVLYPLVDLVAAVVDRRTSGGTGAAPALVVNMALSALGAVGLGFAATSGTAAVLAVWGAWAVAAGAVQLVVALRRRALRGQWPLIVSGGLSVLAGTAFVVQSAAPGASLVNVAGYATLGGIFFLVSALRLHRRVRTSPR
jgi:uncharacterized membrane protein HdeD (DUF308 family)